MKCKCSLNNNYQVIGLCDMGKFNEKIAQFIDESWAQITIPEKVAIPSNKPGVKTITKIYLDIKITSNKIIQTPVSDMPSIEGINLTGKLLLVSGEICQNIIYIPEGLCSSMCSVKFKNPFSTYIVIEEDADLDNDAYCVYPCIEDVSIRPLDERNLSKNITLFLFARRIPKPFNNDIIFKNESGDELSKIKFDINTNMLIVSFIESNNNDSKVLKFELYRKDGTTLRIQGTINANGNAEQFAQDLNNQRFYFNDIINISYDNKPNKILIKNFPNIGEEYNPKLDKNEAFIITRNGLTPYVLPNKIILNNSTDQKIVEVTFSKFGNELKIISTGNMASVTDNFTVKLFKANSRDEFQGIIAANGDGSQFKTQLEEKVYSIGDVIQINSNIPQNAKITNFQNMGNIYGLTEDTERFKITEKGLKKIDIIARYANEIQLGNTSNQRLATVRFDTITNVLRIDRNTSGVVQNDSEILRIELYKKDGITLKAIGQIDANANAIKFNTDLEGEFFEYDDIINVFYESKPTKVSILDFPSTGSNYNPKLDNNEAFVITKNGLEKYVLRDKIVSANGSSDMAELYFSKFNNQLKVISTGNIAPSKEAGSQFTDYFKLVVNRNNQTQLTGVIQYSQSASSFKQVLEAQNYSIGDILEVTSAKELKTRIENTRTGAITITNKNLMRYEITEDGLIEI